jgi:hypothetical protein
MVAQAGLKWQDDGEPAVQGLHYVQSPRCSAGSPLSLYPCALRAQTTNASITGQVTDPSKAVIGEAKVAAVKR